MTFQIVAEIYLSASAEVTAAAINGGIERHSIAGFPGRNVLSNFRDRSRGLMSIMTDWRDPAAGASVHPVNIAAADAAGSDFDEHGAVFQDRLWDIEVFKFFVFLKLQRFHLFSGIERD